jgi:glycosyltransferase involved in cell wall biosynthesis
MPASIAAIIPTHNSHATIERALQSVRMQHHPVSEVWVVDDASTDDTLDVASRFIERHELDNWHLLRQPKNQGPGATRHAGAQRANSDYLAFLDADDEWLPHALENALKQIKMRGWHLFGAQFADLHEPMASLQAFLATSQAVSFFSLLWRNQFLTSTVVIDRQCYLKSGGFDLAQRYSEDYRLWLTIAADPQNRCGITQAVHARYAPDMGQTATASTSASRLSKQHWLMERNELQNFFRLWRQGKLNTVWCLLASAFSLAKYGLRAWRR